MSKSQPLKLSDLRPSVDYPVVGPPSDQTEHRCLFHVKLTDFSMRSIESLLNSDKDACFSLWFAEGGGTISVPGSKTFTFKTSQGDIDGLECVHQALDSSKNPQLNCWGQIRYKLQVQGTEEVYKRTMNLIKVTEEQKHKSMAQTINFPITTNKGRSKSGHPGRSSGGRPLSKTSSPFSAPSVPPSSHSFSTSSSSSSASAQNTSGGSGNTGTFSSKFSAASGGSSSGNSGPFANGSGSGGSGVATGNSGSHGNKGPGRKSTKAPHTLRERIIHLLAVKPQKRTDVINRLKKETKRGETAMTKTDSLLQEVADLQGDMFHLKQSLYSELRVDDWPFYSDAERQLVKRKHGSGSGGGVAGDIFSDMLKRTSSRDQPAAKRQKLSHPPPSSTPPPPHQGYTQPTKKPSPPPPPHPPHSSSTKFSSSSSSSSALSSHFNMPLFGMDSSNLTNQSSNIEMHTNSSTTKPPTQYPEFSFSNFIRSSSGSSTSQLTSTLPTSRPSSSSSSSANPSLHLTDTGTRTVSTGHQSNQQSTTAIQPPSHPPTGQANPPMGQPPGGDHQVPIKEGKLFGDLIPPGSTAAQTEPASDSVAKKRKKKKNLHKTKERVQEKMVVDEEEKKKESIKVVEEMKAKRVKREETEERSERGRHGAMTVKREPLDPPQHPPPLEEGGASSTTPTSVDLELRFPPITSDIVRSEYKRIFNEEYQEYLALKAQVEIINKEVTALSNQMAAVKKGTEEAKLLKRKIREKYTELQQNKTYQTQKRRFQELHTKLGHIKQLVVAYDHHH